MGDLEDLVARAQAGDGAAYEEIVRRFEEMAFSYAYSVLADPELAEDARQEAFIGAYVDLLSLRDPAAFPGWFRRIVHNCALQHKRGRRLLTVPLDDVQEAASPHGGPGRHAEQNEAREQVEQALRRLPSQEEEAVRLFYLDGLSLREIMRVTGATSEAIRGRLHSARARLRQRLMGMAKDTVLRQSKSGDKRPARAAAAEALGQVEKRLAKILRVPAHEERDEACDLLRAAGRFHRVLGHVDQALASFDKGMALALLNGGAADRARFHTEKGLTLLQSGDYGSARRELDSSRGLLRGRNGHSDTLAATLNGLGACAWGEGDFGKARRYFVQTLAQSRRARCAALEAEALNNLALLDWKAGTLSSALRNFQSALRRWKSLGVKYGIVVTLMNLGIAEENLGRARAAARRYQEALALAEEVGFVQVQAATLSNLGNLALAAENWPEAIRQNARALELARQIRDRRSEAIAQENLAMAHGGAGNVREAQKALRAAIGVANRIGDRERIFSLRLVEAEMAIVAGRGAAARQILAEARVELAEQGYLSEFPRLLRLEGCALTAEALHREAGRVFRKALQECDRQNNGAERKRIERLQSDLSSDGPVSMARKPMSRKR